MFQRLPILLAAILFGYLSSTAISRADDEEKHPIDVAYDACMEKNSSTAGMVACTEKAYKKWDAELNRVYTELLEGLDDEAGAKLRKAQRDWITYRDSNFKMIDEIYGSIEGTMYRPMHIYARLRVVRDRAKELIALVELQKEQ